MTSRFSCLPLRRAISIAAVLALVTLASNCDRTSAATDSVPVGAGSYLERTPEGCKPLPEEIYRESESHRPTPTNQWWSSLVWNQFSQNLFPHPLAMACRENGLAVTYPGAAIVSNESGIIGGGLSKEGDFLIGNSSVTNFEEVVLDDYSDWFITADFKAGEAGIKLSFGHGSPFIYCRPRGGSGRITFPEAPQLWSGTDKDVTIGLTIRGNHYGLFGPEGSSWSGMQSAEFALDSEKDYFSVALLPDNKPETLKLFSSFAHNHVTGTRLVPKIGNGRVDADYRFTLDPMEGDGSGTLFALYPHQWKYSSAPLTGHSYSSVRGEMKLASGSSFETSVPIQGLLPMLPAEGIPDRDRMLSYLQSEAPKEVTEFADTYWEGKHLGKLATLSGIAELIGEPELQAGYIAEMKTRLENWFTASPGEESPLFYYNENWGTLIGSKASFGSDAEMNDHHFHYGYFIRAAAEIARVEPKWVEKWGPMVELLIRDIASPSPEDPMFPKLRCFDLYAGHSWASGHANFGDGNNQESSSESLNAWYALMLWGAATGNETTRDLGTFLYNTERTAVEEYWFDVSGTNFPAAFPQVALGMVWGGKGAFATWFSGDIDHIHGINWLPFTPSSVTMGRFPDYVKRNHDRIVSVREDGRDYNTGWGDLIVMFYALSDPETAIAYLDANPTCSLEGGNTHAFMYQWVNTLGSLGLIDMEITADHPFVNVYKKGEDRTYAAYNFGKAPLKVTFSDGTVLEAAPKTLTIAR